MTGFLRADFIAVLEGSLTCIIC